MAKSVVRLKSILIKNFKNVKCGYLNFENLRKNYQASVLGLYGQNGSGKTAMIDTIDLLKCVLSGQSIPIYFADYINVDSNRAELKYEFLIKNSENGSVYNAFFEFAICRAIDDANTNTSDTNNIHKLYKVVISDESLSYSYTSQNDKNRLSTLIDTKTDDIFAPKIKLKLLIGEGKSQITDLLVAKKLTSATSRSFVFSKELLTVIRQRCRSQKDMFLIESLVNFGNYELFVINTSNTGLISMNALPLAFKYEGANTIATGSLMISLNDPNTIPKEAVIIIKKVIDAMNIVLPKIIPDLTLGINILGEEVIADKQVGCRIQLLSLKNDREIPLRLESEGVKKLISILQLMIVIYNKPSITVAIDELDSGVFEYLLGELLRIISERGKGQLIFTSHNLRPLETLDSGFIAFTTTNKSNRYLKITNIKSTNNLRDIYYRSIVLGEKNDSVYDMTNNSEIAIAFKEAGTINE